MTGAVSARRPEAIERLGQTRPLAPAPNRKPPTTTLAMAAPPASSTGAVSPPTPPPPSPRAPPTEAIKPSGRPVPPRPPPPNRAPPATALAMAGSVRCLGRAAATMDRTP
jgi:hypothetical protein